MRAIVALCLVLLAPSLRAQAPKSFAEGVLAFEKGEWKKAEQLMRDTIAGNPNESAGTVSISGSWYETYVPHYFLARALAKQKKCGEALVAFAESERQGITPTIPDFARHLKTRGGCQPQAAPRERTRVVKEVTVPFGEESAVPEQEQPRPEPARTGAIKPGAATPPDAGSRDVSRPASRVEDVAGRTRKRLTDAVTAYLGGRYEEALHILSEAPFSDPDAAAEAALFRAAANHALYRMDGARNDALRDVIASELRTYRRLRPNGRPDPRIFSPRFIAMMP